MLNMRVSLLIVVAIQAVSGQMSSEPEPAMGCPDNQYMCETDFTSYCEDIGTCCEGSYKCPSGSVDPCADGLNTFCACDASIPMVDCYVDKYNAEGEYLYTNYSCVASDADCPCADGYNKCTDKFGPWCQLEPCPCKGLEITCHGYSYDADGIPFDTPVTCVMDINDCACGAGALSTPCTEEAGTLFECIPSGQSCPVVCNETSEKYCEAYPFDANGNENRDAKPNISCAPLSSGCPCNDQWQVQCVDPIYGDTWCQSKDFNCPITCTAPESPCSYHEFNADGTYALDSSGFPKWMEKCVNLTSDGDCPCDPDYEIGCVLGSGASEYTQCIFQDSDELVDGNCPVNCEAQGQVECWPEGFDANGEPTLGQATASGQYIGVCQDSYPCDYDFTNGKICPGVETFVWNQTACPVVCTDTEEMCQVYLFTPGTNEYNGSYVDECRSMGDLCCDLVNGQECPSPDGGYCLGASETCYLYCNSTQRICTHEAFYANGSHIEASFNDESCQNKDVACTCGAGAVLCNPNSPATAYCIPSTFDNGPLGEPDIIANTCPVDCNAQQEVCGTTDYDTKGNFVRYSERCIARSIYAKQGCPCGGNSTQCRYGSNPSDFYCEPLWDQAEGRMFKCPLHCGDAEKPDIKYVPNFDSNGNYIEGSFVEYCGAANAAPECARGQGATSCVIDGTPECIPTVGANAFCPISCPADKIQCLAMDNYNTTTGEWVSSTAPPTSQACQDKYEDCPCGAGTRPCNGICLPTALSCPVICTTAEKPNLCTVTHYTGLEPTGETEYCISDNATCPCGSGATPCSQKLGDTFEDVCYPTESAAYICPCKVGEKACNVVNFNTNGAEAEPSIVCVGANSPCPCGTHATTCKDGSCVAKYAKEGGCYQYCTIAEETAAIEKKTCKRSNLDKKTGAPASTVVQCATSCTAGRGQKKCGSGAIIPSQNKCSDIYGLKTAASGLRRLAVASGQSQTSSVSFTIENLKNPMASVASTKPKIDGILQIQPTLDTELIRQVGTTEASLQYKVTNLGKSDVAPSAVVDALKRMLNTKSPDIINALAGMGTVKLGSRGCCSSTIVSKVNVVVSTTPPPTSTAAEVGYNLSYNQTSVSYNQSVNQSESSTTSSSASPTPSPSPTSTSSSSSAASPTPSPSPTSTSTTPGASTSVVGYSSSYTGSLYLTMRNCTQFKSDTAAQNALGESIADQITGVTANDVDTTTTCSAGGRRLSEDEKFEAAMRRLTETATVAFTITIVASTPSTDHSTAVTQINALTATAVHQTLATKLTALGKIDDYNITVVSLGTPALEVTSSTAMATSSSSAATDLFEDDDDGSVRSSIAWTTLVVLLAAIYRKC